MGKITKADLRTIREIYGKIADDMLPLVEAKLSAMIAAGDNTPVMRPEPLFGQNAMRICLEQVIDCMGRTAPTTAHAKAFVIELGVRLAAYSITALPIEEQAEALANFIEALPGAVNEKLKVGAIIKCQWLDDDTKIFTNNVPSKSDVQ